MRFHSIRWQIQLWHGVLLVAVTAVLLVGFYRYQEKMLEESLKSEMTAPIISLLPRHVPLPSPIGETVGTPPETKPTAGMPNFEKGLEARGYYIGVWSADHVPGYTSPGLPPAIALPDHKGVEPEWITRWNAGNFELLHVTPHGRIVLIGISGAEMRARLHRFGWKLAAIGFGVVGLGLAGGWWMAGRAIRPIRDITETAQRLATGDRQQRIPLENMQNELGGLAGVLNETFDRLAGAYEQQVRFTADASHELRTPVTIVLAQTQMALSRDRDPAAYREALEACRRSAERMTQLLNELLDLSHYDSDEPQLRLLECDLSEVVREALDFIQPLATERGVRITFSQEAITGRFDPVRLSHALVNVLINAVKHNPEGTQVTVTLVREAEGGARLVIADNGRGIPPEALPHLFERFFRVDKARSRETGGGGLGLAIAKAIVDAHGGTIGVASKVGVGTTFTITLD